MILQGTVQEEIKKIIRREQVLLRQTIAKIESDNALRQRLLDENGEDGYLSMIIIPKCDPRKHKELLNDWNQLELFVFDVFKPSQAFPVSRWVNYTAMALWLLQVIKKECKRHDDLLMENVLRNVLEKERLVVMKREQEEEDGIGTFRSNFDATPIPQKYIDNQGYWKEILDMIIEILINRGCA